MKIDYIFDGREFEYEVSRDDVIYALEKIFAKRFFGGDFKKSKEMFEYFDIMNTIDCLRDDFIEDLEKYFEKEAYSDFCDDTDDGLASAYPNGTYF